MTETKAGHAGLVQDLILLMGRAEAVIDAYRTILTGFAFPDDLDDCYSNLKEIEERIKFAKECDKLVPEKLLDSQEKLQEYDEHLSKAQLKNDPNEIPDILIDTDQNTEPLNKKSRLEILAEERDIKRRRQSYKGKTHTGSKSYTEVIREVIVNQSEMLAELWGTSTVKQEETAARTCDLVMKPLETSFNCGITFKPKDCETSHSQCLKEEPVEYTSGSDGIELSHQRLIQSTGDHDSVSVEHRDIDDKSRDHHHERKRHHSSKKRHHKKRRRRSHESDE